MTEEPVKDEAAAIRAHWMRNMSAAGVAEAMTTALQSGEFAELIQAGWTISARTGASLGGNLHNLLIEVAADAGFDGQVVIIAIHRPMP